MMELKSVGVSTAESRALAAVVGRLYACAVVAKMDYGDGFLVSQMKLAAKEVLEVEMKLKGACVSA